MRENDRNLGKCNKLQKKGIFPLAQKANCCAWTRQNVLFSKGKKHGSVLKKGDNDYCGINAISGDLRGVCCQGEPKNSAGDCDAVNWPKGVAFDHILAFARDEKHFYDHFAKAWKVAVDNGFPKPLQPL